jgi:hypothetical protein
MVTYLHLGKNVVVNTNTIIGVFDMDQTTVSAHTRKYLAKAQKENRVVNVSMELPKSFVVCKEKNREILYISQISSSTLLRRAKGQQSREFEIETM